MDVSEELSSPCPAQILEEGRALSEHPLVKGECHMSCHVTHVVSSKPRPPAAGPEWLVGWDIVCLVGSLLELLYGFVSI